MNDNNFQQSNFQNNSQQESVSNNVQAQMIQNNMDNNMQQVSQSVSEVNTLKPNKLNNKIVIILIIVLLILIGVIAYLFLMKSNENNTNTANSRENTNNVNTDVTNTPQVENKKQVDESNNNVVASVDSIFQASVNNVVIKFPATKESFNGTGWKWDEKYANTDLANGYTTSGGRIGTYPGGVVVSVINNSGVTKHISDCIIDDGTFYNPKDGSKNVTFVGGLNFSSTMEEVKNTMKNLGYNNLKEKKIDDAVYYDYYLDDNQSNYKDYIEFYYFREVLQSIGIYTSGK